MELIVKVNDGGSYKDGDIVQAFSMEQVYTCHAEQKCHIDNFPLDTVSGLRPNDPLLIKFMERTNTFKYERVNSNDILRTNLITNIQDTLNTIPNDNGEYINAYYFIVSRLKKRRHSIFGTCGNEVWYGKRRANVDISAIWNDIETHTDFLQTDHTNWPLSDIEKTHFLPLNCRGFRNAVYTELSAGSVEERNEGVYNTENAGTEEESLSVIAKRKWQIPYWNLTGSLSINVDDVRNMSVEVEARVGMNDRPKIDDVNIDKVAAGIITI